MRAAPSTPVNEASIASLSAQLQSLRRVALAVAQPGGPNLFDDLVYELAAALDVAAVLVAVFADDACSVLQTLAVRLDGKVLQRFDYPLEGSPCAQVVGREFRYVARGVAAEFPPGTLFAAKGMDSYAAFPLNDSSGAPLGLLVAMDRQSIAAGDADHAEAMLKIVAGRVAAEIERAHADEVLRSAALAVSGARSDTVFDELVRLLAAILHVEVAFIARHEADDPRHLHMLAMYYDGQILRDLRYAMAGTPCETVFGQRFRAYPHDLQRLFPDDQDAKALCAVSYAGYPLTGLDGKPLGIVSVASRRPLAHLDRVKSMLKIFAVRAAAEIERLAASEALQRSEASYRTIFETAEDAIFIHDWDSGEIIDANPKACEIYGYSHEELTHLSVANISSGVPPYTGEQALRWIELAKLDRCPPFEWERRNKDGSLHWDEVRLKPATINGRPHVLAFPHEITERRERERALQRSEAQYRAIFDGSADAMVLWNRELRIVDVNAAFTRFYGYRRDEVIGESFGRRIGAEGVARRVQLIRAALEGREGMMETQAVRKDGSRFDVELRYLPIAHAGSPHVLAVGRDITDRLERDRALQHSEARLRATVEAAFDCVIAMDGEGRIVEFNAAAERVIGHRRGDVLGRPFGDVILPQRFRDSHERWLKNYPVNGSAGRIGRLVETQALLADGSEIPVEVAVSVAAAPEGNIFVGHLRDISARRAAESARAALEAQLRQAQKMEAIGQLTGGIAHDFNNILTSVIGYLVLGEERAEALADPALVRQLGQAHLAAQRARDLIAQMLAFARRQRGERRVLDLAPLVRQTLRLLRATLPSSVTLDGSAGALDADAPDEALAPWVAADPVQLEQVLFNLCINARDALEGAGRIQVRLRTHEHARNWQCASCRAPVGDGPWVELSVADSGCGIEPELMERIFDPFFSTKAPGSGSGMGLAMVHGIVHDHGGHVRVQAEPGAGSVFSVLLPRVAAPARAPVASAPEQAAAPPALRGRVLLVEDDPMVGDYMVERLQSWGLEVLLQHEPAAAEVWLRDPAHEADLLITDQTMPQMTGLQLAARARSLRPALPVLLVSGNAATFDPAELARCGVRAALGKPLDAQRLRALLREALGAGALASSSA